MASVLRQKQSAAGHLNQAEYSTYPSSLSSYLNRPLPPLPTNISSHIHHIDASSRWLHSSSNNTVSPSSAFLFTTNDEGYDVAEFHRSAALMLAGHGSMPRADHAAVISAEPLHPCNAPREVESESESVSGQVRSFPCSRGKSCSTQFCLRRHSETCVEADQGLDLPSDVIYTPSVKLECKNSLASGDDAVLSILDGTTVSRQFWIHHGDHTWHHPTSSPRDSGSHTSNAIMDAVSNAMSCVTQPGFQPSFIQCELCGDCFSSHSDEDFASHIGQHSLDFAEKRHECDECKIFFASERDLRRHLQSARLTQHCGLNFVHTNDKGDDESCCTGHHPPTYFKTCLPNDHDLMAGHLWAWESSQLEAHRRIVTEVLTAKLHYQKRSAPPTLNVISTSPPSPTCSLASSASEYSVESFTPSRISSLTVSASLTSTSIPPLQFSSKSKRAAIIPHRVSIIQDESRPEELRRPSSALSFAPSPRLSALCVSTSTDDSFRNSLERDSTRCDSLLVDDFLYKQTLLDIYAGNRTHITDDDDANDDFIPTPAMTYYTDEVDARPDSGVLPNDSMSYYSISSQFFAVDTHSTFSSRPSTSSSNPISSVVHSIKKEIFPQQSSLRNLARFYRRKTKHRLAPADSLFDSASASSSSSLSSSLNEDEKPFSGEERIFQDRENTVRGNGMQSASHVVLGAA